MQPGALYFAFAFDPCIRALKMTDWQAPSVIATEGETLIRLTHAVAGVYIWECAFTLNFEWSFYCGKRPWKWPILLYLLSRYCVLLAIIGQLVIFNTTTEINCSALERVIEVFAFVGMDSASSLIALRAFAFWRRNYYILAIISAALVANIGIQIHDIVVATASWDPDALSCTIADTSRMQLQLITTFATDVLLLALMVVGLIMQRAPTTLYKLLRNQGILWAFVATLSYIPPVLLSCLNFNDVMNLMTPTLSYVTLVICATRMHRNLTESMIPVPRAKTTIVSSIHFESSAMDPELIPHQKNNEVVRKADEVVDITGDPCTTSDHAYDA